VGKTLIARLLTEFPAAAQGRGRRLRHHLREPALIDYLPRVTETARIDDPSARGAVDRLIVNDGIPK